MEAVTTHQARETMFWIDGWRYPRHARIEEDGTIRIEIARVACRHCPTCQGRVRTVEYRLRNRNGWGWEQRGTGLYLVIAGENGSTATANLLRAVLGTDVVEMGQ